MDTYHTLTKKEQLKHYKKVEPHLTVSNHSKVERDMEKIQNTYDGLKKYAIFEIYLKIKEPSFVEYLKKKQQQVVN